MESGQLWQHLAEDEVREEASRRLRSWITCMLGTRANLCSTFFLCLVVWRQRNGSAGRSA